MSLKMAASIDENTDVNCSNESFSHVLGVRGLSIRMAKHAMASRKILRKINVSSRDGMRCLVPGAAVRGGLVCVIPQFTFLRPITTIRVRLRKSNQRLNNTIRDEGEEIPLGGFDEITMSLNSLLSSFSCISFGMRCLSEESFDA